MADSQITETGVSIGQAMATAERPLKPSSQNLDSGVRQVLARLRNRVRRYVWLQGLAMVLACLGLCFWALLAIDWYWEPSVDVRKLLLGAGALLTGWVAYYWIGRRAFVPLTDSNMAVLLERRFRGLEDSLLTTVELTDQANLAEFTREMLAHTSADAVVRAGKVDLGEVFDLAPLRRAVLLALALVVSIGGFAIASPESFRFFVEERMAGMTQQLWPRKSRLIVEGFKDGEVVIAKGSNLDLLVRADTTMEVPDKVQVRYRNADGQRRSEQMVREGEAVAGRDEYQDFRYTFENVISPYTFEVVGGDSRVRNLRIRVVDAPVIELQLHVEYPSYLHRASRAQPVTGIMQVPAGSRVTVKGHANKDLVKVEVDYPTPVKKGQKPTDKSFETHTLVLPQAGGTSRSFEFPVESLDSDLTLSFTLHDVDGIKSREPFRLALSATPDAAPQLHLRLKGISSVITPLARLPVTGEMRDDYGLARGWFEYAIDEKAVHEQPFINQPKGSDKVDVSEAFEARDLELKPGQKLLIGTAASDEHDLPPEKQPHVGHGERFQLTVVTPGELRSLLESRELNLRQRFETIIGEVTETRDTLTRLELGDPPAAADKPATEKPDAAKNEKDAKNVKDDKSGKDATDSGDEPATGGNTPEQLQAGRLLRVQGILQNSQKSAQETGGVAISFDDIREELINNRVDTEELRIRLKDYIADPLRQIAEESFPEFDKRLTRIQSLIQSKGGLEETLAAKTTAIQQADALVLAMEKVRDKMLELESFNEAVDLLRGIISSQQQMNEQTKKLRSEKIKKLLD
jgi:hypothetical protein